jgi:hypothetical protein
VRLQLTIAALLALSGVAWADDSFVAKTQVYVDNDHTTVVSPLVGISKDAWQGGTLGASYVADVVSSASIDVVSNATHQMNDLRNEVTGSITQKLKDTTLSGAYIYSSEHDYWSNNLAFSLSQDLFQKNTTLALGYALALNDVGRTGDQAFHRSLQVHSLSGSWTQVLTKSTILQGSYTFGYLNGYMSSPYRFVRIDTPDASDIAFKIPENDPSVRIRHAFVVGFNQHVGKDSSVQADYRLYFDSWGLISHTVQLRYFVNFGSFTLRLRERFYYQKGADFFQTNYTSDHLQPYVTADRELSTFWSNVAGIKASWKLPVLHRALEIELKADFFYFKYIDFALLTSRLGADLGAGLALAF